MITRRLSHKGKDVISRIVRFDTNPVREGRALDREVSRESTRASHFDSDRSESIDFDSCISPSHEQRPAAKAPDELLRSFIACGGDRRRSLSCDSTLDYDSCLSPVSTPRWTLCELEEFRQSASTKSFAELHALLLAGCITHFAARPGPDGHMTLEVCPTVKPKTVVISGSFNPIHYGHENLARRAVEQASGASGEYLFEISTLNVDKGPISAAEMERRVDLITKRGHSCMLTSATLFDAKSELFPNCIFAIGFDTYVRVINPKYYPRLIGGLDGTLARIEANGCEFFVGGRIAEGIYRSLAPSPLVGFRNDRSISLDVEFELVESSHESFRPKPVCKPTERNNIDLLCEEEPVSPIFTPIPEFRFDISSTQIRSQSLESP